MDLMEFKTRNIYNEIEDGSITCKSPSNIALIKYWGKKDIQIPLNPSISFTLDNCNTTTTLTYQKKSTNDISFELFFDGNSKEEFEPKISQFFNRVIDYVPFLNSYHFKIDTANTFPHSSGIASSASGMSALATCIVELEQKLSQEMSLNEIRRKASFLSRLGSGSACRSIEGPMVLWGKHRSIKESSDIYGIKLPIEINQVYNNYQDTILIVDKGQKLVSSSVGHELMNNHDFKTQRFVQARNRVTQIISALQSGDLMGFIKIVELEALTLHAMMMSSDPYYILMRPNTLKIINKVWEFRKSTSIPVCFTLDAGANVHILYPKTFQKPIDNFIKKELLKYCQDGQFIADCVGGGVKII